jgi:hypothetical protein
MLTLRLYVGVCDTVTRGPFDEKRSFVFLQISCVAILVIIVCWEQTLVKLWWCVSLSVLQMCLQRCFSIQHTRSMFAPVGLYCRCAFRGVSVYSIACLHLLVLQMCLERCFSIQHSMQAGVADFMYCWCMFSRLIAICTVRTSKLMMWRYFVSHFIKLICNFTDDVENRVHPLHAQICMAYEFLYSLDSPSLLLHKLRCAEASRLKLFPLKNNPLCSVISHNSR